MKQPTTQELFQLANEGVRSQIKRAVMHRDVKGINLLPQLAQVVTDMYANRGLYPICLDCPVNLTCLRRQPVGYWCPSCTHFYVTEIEKRINCDAIEKESSLPQGRCPWCDGGQGTLIVQGVQLDWDENGGSVR
ncbi:MAG: hypothetical protein ACYTEQ_15630 [Planctomycetota bacterium]